jgi:hypothetical protein
VGPAHRPHARRRRRRPVAARLHRPPRRALSLPERAVDIIPLTLTVFDGHSDRVTLTAEHVVSNEPPTLSAFTPPSAGAGGAGGRCGRATTR